jgi:hypothetical protein
MKADPAARRAQKPKSFLLLFFKKEGLSYPPARQCTVDPAAGPPKNTLY